MADTKGTKGTKATQGTSRADDNTGFIPPHGGYQKLLSYQKAEIVFDATVHFCNRFISIRDRTHDQMVQAARSGKQNIAEGSQVSGTSKELEIKLTNVARASLEELLNDYRDFLRIRGLRRGTIVHIKGAGHNVRRDQKDRLLKALAAFLGELDSQKAE